MAILMTTTRYRNLPPAPSAPQRVNTLAQWTCLHALGALIIALVASTQAHAAGVEHLNRRLEAIVKHLLPQNYSISVQVADLETGRVLMEMNPYLPLVPASTMKIVTSAAALKTLKPDFTFLTDVYADKADAASVKNIYLKGTGDPYLVSEQLFALTRALRDKGLREIRGNICVDDSYFIPSKPLDEKESLGPRSYHAPYGAVSLNFNTIKVIVHPADKPGKNAQIIVDPVSEYAVVKGKVKTVRGKKSERPSITKKTAPDGREVISLTGEIGVRAPAKGMYVNVASPALYAGGVFKEFLLREGIKVTGKVVHGTTPPSAVSYLEFNSLPLGIVVYWLNKYSNNFMAEQICLALGASVHGVPGTREKGLSVIRKHLRECLVEEGCFDLKDASGLSRSNRLSASALVKVLYAAAHDFTYNAEFMASLGVAGVDGTLKDKFTDPREKRRLRAKTGTLRGVNALAGYGRSRDGRTFAFAVLVNSVRDDVGFIRYADDVAQAIMDIPLSTR